MKLSRIIWYGIAGVVAGLLIENKSLRVKGKVVDEKQKLRRKVAKVVHGRS